jgi:hypothetical protein
MDNIDSEREPEGESPLKDDSNDIFKLMVEEARESLFQLETITTALDFKAYGLISFNTIILTGVAYFIGVYHSKLLYFPAIFLIYSLILVLFCISPRTSHRMTGETIIHLYGEMGFDDAAGQLALNYAGLEKELNDIYAIKYKYLECSLTFTILAVISGPVALAYLIFHF